MTVYKPVTNEAVRAAEEAVRLAKGEKRTQMHNEQR